MKKAWVFVFCELLFSLLNDGHYCEEELISPFVQDVLNVCYKI